MGLDMYLHRVEKKEIAYWRKHNRLHGWFEKKWHELGNEHELNVTDFYLDEEILNELEDAIKNDKLPKTEGFFFGEDSYNNEEAETRKQEDLNFVKKAKEMVRNGDQVAYFAWY
jgi:hypothetical protein